MSTPPVEKLRRKGCCGDGRRESHGGGDDGARGGCGDGGCHAGAGAGRRRVRVPAGPPAARVCALLRLAHGLLRLAHPPPPLCFVWLTPYIFHIPPKFSQAVGVGAPDLRTTPRSESNRRRLDNTTSDGSPSL